MTTMRALVPCLALVVAAACRQSPLETTGAGGAPPTGGAGGAAGASTGGASAGGASAGGGGGAPAVGGVSGAQAGLGGAAGEIPDSGPDSQASGGAGATVFCGVETCGPNTKCCPGTGRCYEPKTNACVWIGCAIGGCPGPPSPDASAVDAGNCCRASDLVYCPTTHNCVHKDCKDCCPPDKACNQNSDCPQGLSCCYSQRRCFNPLITSCDPGPPPRCDADGRCPGNFVCCQQYGTCYDPACKDCCSATCRPADARCYGGGCCGGLKCCSGPPLRPGEEYCGQTCPISDRNAKRDIVPVDSEEILRRITAMPIAEWSYKDGQPSVRHIGPMAQDFHAAFGTGDTDRCIPTVDANGVALAAIQALSRRLEQLDRATAELRAQNADLRAEVARLKTKRR